MNERNKKPNVGGRIRTLRERRKLSLRALSEASGLSINAIGMIERGENSPTVSSLHALANALHVRIIDLFEEAKEHAVVVVRKEQRLASTGDCGVMESLGQGLRNQQLEPFIVSIQPGCHGTGMDQGTGPVRHSDEEFVYCIDGEIEYEVSDTVYTLNEGDSLVFDATQPHLFRNNSDRPARFIVVFQALDGARLAVQRHLSQEGLPET
jgi:transcriptional regulator with XRE-family HTH domain